MDGFQMFLILLGFVSYVSSFVFSYTNVAGVEGE